ncbi:MAG TPA: peptidoglycan-binding protein [Candidatus Limiplasma sp.]|nr:peptidoglycan-binding protein [Candidatus Limiplasma sp.]
MKRLPISLLCLLCCLLLALPALSQEDTGYQPLQYGDAGEEVTLVQEQLKMLGYYTGKVSGSYLDGTQDAVLQFQKDFDLEETGMVDGETEAVLFSVEYRELTTGDSGDDVKRIQERLVELDYYNGKISGDYLEGTTYGIKLFQEKNGLEATGTADIATQRMLFNGSALSRYAQESTDESALGDTNDIVITSDGEDSGTTAYDLDFIGKITRGAQGNRVKQIQTRLTELHYFDGPISGNYLDKTIEAIKAFQENNGLQVDGITGTDTWSALFDLEYALDASATPRPTPEATTIPYALTVDVKNQAVIAYTYDENGDYTVPVRFMVCSTGTASTPSDVGEFVLDGRKARWAYFSLYGSYAQFWTKINEDIAFHSVIYNEVDLNSLSRKSYNMLGSRASHGCIRLLNGDAQWIYDNVGEGTVVTITEDLALDPELRAALKPKELSSNWSSAPETPTPTASPQYISDAQPPEFRTMKKNSTGEDVYWLQMKLKELGYYQGAMATGTYLDGTVKAVKAFQKDHDLYADGIAGIKTLNAIYADVLATETPEPTATLSPTPAPSSTPAP